MRLIDADKVYPWYLKAFSAEKIGKEREIKPYEVRFSMNDIRENLSNIPTEQEPSEDCISREWIKTALHNFYYGQENMPTEEDIQAYLDAAPRVQPKTRWIPVNEELPEETESVLVYAERNAYDDKGVFRKKVIDIGWQVDGRWHIDGCNGVDGIAWQPLPEPYKGSKG